MRFTKTKALAGAAALALSLSACGDDSSSAAGGIEQEVNTEYKAPAGSTMAEIQNRGQIIIGVKNDQPGLGFLRPGDEIPTGFDVEIGQFIAAQLGLDPTDPSQVKYVETISDNREPFLQEGKVDIVVASYSITDDRRAVVGQAGPYYVTGQQLLVREEDADKFTKPEDMAGAKVCSVEGSTSLETATDEYGAKPESFETYSECVEQLENGTIDAVTTDGAILEGYAAENPDELEVVVEPFSEERYGIGYGFKNGKPDTEFCQFITDTIQTAMDDGTWADAFQSTLGESGVETPEPPAMDPCQ